MIFNFAFGFWIVTTTNTNLIELKPFYVLKTIDIFEFQNDCNSVDFLMSIFTIEIREVVVEKIEVVKRIREIKWHKK